MKKLQPKEYRSLNLAADDDSNDLILTGYPIIWNSESYIGNDELGWYESIDKNALRNTDFSDVALKYNHSDASKIILARARNKTLTLTPDEKGLKMTARLNKDITDHKDIYNSVKGGYLDGMSFCMIIRDGGEKWTRDKDGKPHRLITDIEKLVDVAVVSDPAYLQTEIEARSKNILESITGKLENIPETREPDGEALQLIKTKYKILLSI